MNPDCSNELFRPKGDIAERAHIIPHCETADASFENLVIVCPNCHTDYDKNSAFTPEEIRNWKRIRQQESDKIFAKKFGSFDDLKFAAVPLLSENKTIYEQYYLAGNKNLWDKFEPKILSNNKKLKTLLHNNLELFQSSKSNEESNLDIANKFLLHIDEFEETRMDEEKFREVLFPKKINSIFGIKPINDYIIPMTESLEALISKLCTQSKFGGIALGIENPYFILRLSGKDEKVYISDLPRYRQMLYDNKCFIKIKMRFKDLNYALKLISDSGAKFRFIKSDNLREIIVNGKKITFIYEYCLSKAQLIELHPQRNSVYVNLNTWGGINISNEAYKYASQIGVKLLDKKGLYAYIRKI